VVIGWLRLDFKVERASMRDKDLLMDLPVQIGCGEPAGGSVRGSVARRGTSD
jgi:hypothetical protein